MKILTKLGEKNALLEVSGRVGWQNSLVLNHEFKKLTDYNPEVIILRLFDISFFSSSAIAIIASNAKKFIDSQIGNFYLISEGNYLNEILTTTGLISVLKGNVFTSQKLLFEATGIQLDQMLHETVNKFNTEELC